MLNLASYIHSPDHSTKGTISHIDVLYVLVSIRFQVLFHSPPGVLFTFPSQYYFTIGHQVVFRLGGWSPRIPTGFHVSGGTLDTAGCLHLSLTRLSLSMVGLPMPFVWPLPRSLATTDGISVDVFSSPYLDVSVQAVPHIHLCIQCMLTILQIAGFPHSEIHGSLAACASPWHIAGCRVLHRLLMPRHSPYALCSLTIVFS